MSRRQELLDKFARTGRLSPAEDYELCETRAAEPSNQSALSKSQAREIVINQIATEEWNKVQSEKEMRRMIDSEVAKVRREIQELQPPAVRAARALRDLLKSRRLRKSSSTVATPPAKSEITVSQLAAEIAARSPDLAFTAGCALAKQALRSPVNMNPFDSSHVPTVPGGSRSLGDVGGKFETAGGQDPWSDENMARVGSADALARLVQGAMKATVLATRY